MSMWVFLVIGVGMVAAFLAGRYLLNCLINYAYAWLEERD